MKKSYIFFNKIFKTKKLNPKYNVNLYRVNLYIYSVINLRIYNIRIINSKNNKQFNIFHIPYNMIY